MMRSTSPIISGAPLAAETGAPPSASFILVVWRLVFKRTIGGTVEIIELPRTQRPQERNETERAKNERGGDKPSKCRHDRPHPAKREALSVTRIDELDMTMAAMSGVTKPAMASGTQTIL